MNWDARLYDEQSRTREEAGQRLMDRAGIVPEDRVLDIGCGTGALTTRMARLAHRGSVVGLDPSDEMLAIARAKAMPLGNVKLVRRTVEDMDFREEFSLAYSNLSLHWVKGQEGALRNIHDALEPGGRLALLLPARGFSSALSESISEAMDELELHEFSDGWESPWYLPEQDEYDALLYEAGFTGVKVRHDDFSMSFGNVHAALDWALSAALVPYMDRLDWRTGEYFKKHVAMNFASRMGREGIVFEFRRLMAFAHRPH